MGERWCKLYPHAQTDPLWIAIAADAGTSRGLVGDTFVQLLCWVTEHSPDSGSIAGFDPRVWAAWKEVAVDEIERVIAALRKFGRIAGDCLANWAKRQGAAVAAKFSGANDNAQPRPKSTPRTRKHRAERRAASQQLSLLLPMSGGVPAPSGTPVPTPPGTPKDDDISNSSAVPAAPEKREDSERSLETESSYSNAVPSKTVLNDSKNEEGVSRRTAPLDDDLAPTRRAKRFNMLKTLRRWVLSSPHQTEVDRADYLAMLGRAEYALDDWNSRSLVDKHWLDELKRKADRLPLDDQTVTFHHMAEHGGVYRSKRFWKRAMAATEAAHAAAGMSFDAAAATP